MELTLNNRVFDLLEEGYDLVLRTGALPDSGLIARRLAPYRLVACASPEYLARHAPPQVPADLAAHACLGFHPGAAFDTWRFTDPATGAVIPVQVTGPMAANDGHALRHAALGGAGILLQAEALLMPDVQAGRLVKVLENYPPQALPLHALYSPTRVIPPKLRSFIDFLASGFGAGRIPPDAVPLRVPDGH